MNPAVQRSRRAKRHLLLALTVLFVFGAASIAEPPASGKSSAPKIHRVVVQLTSDGEEHWNAAINQIENLKKGLAPDSVEIELVTHGNAAGFVLAKNTAVSARIQKIEAAGAQVTFCANTQKKNGIQAEELTPGVTVIPSGIVQVVRRQEEGWSYIKAGP
jgi:intracellular sulfur oxidation DsrE/DsrF family protein